MSSVLLVSADELQFLDPSPGDAGSQTPRRFSVTAWRDLGETVAFALEPSAAGESGEAITIEDLGAQLPDWEDQDLLSLILQGYFASLCEGLPVGVRTLPRRVYFPFWMGPRERRLLRRAAQAAGLSLSGEVERGLAPVLTRVWEGGDPPRSGGWIVADRCGFDLDLYGVSDRIAEAGREIGLVEYRRCTQIFSSYYAARPSAAGQAVTEALATLPAAWRRLATDRLAAELLHAQETAVGVGEIRSFTDHRAALEEHERAIEPVPVVLSRHWFYWLDYGDERLELLDDGRQYPRRVERLLSIPEPPPEQFQIGVRVGFHPTRPETQEICQVRISRPDLHYASGFLLVLLRLRGQGSGSLEIDVIQRGKSVHAAKAHFSPNADEGS